MTGVREMVFRDLYRGRIVYGRTRWVDRGGTKVKRPCPPSEWVTIEAPDLRLVSEELYQAAHARLERTRQTYLRHTGGQLYGRPDSGLEARHLLSGFLVCGACGGAMHAIKRTSRRGAARVYFLCNGWRVNGSCDNGMSAHLTDVDAAIIGALRRDVLAPDVVEDVITRALDLHRSEPDAIEARRRQFTADAARVGGELARLTDAIRLGGPLASLVAEAQRLEEQRAGVLAQLEHLDGLSRAAVTWGDDLRRELRRRLTDWQGLIGRQPAVARQIFRKLLVGRLTMNPKITAEGRWYEITGQATYGPLVAGVVGLVPPGANERAYNIQVSVLVRAA